MASKCAIPIENARKFTLNQVFDVYCSNTAPVPRSPYSLASFVAVTCWKALNT